MRVLGLALAFLAASEVRARRAFVFEFTRMDSPLANVAVPPDLGAGLRGLVFHVDFASNFFFDSTQFPFVQFHFLFVFGFVEILLDVFQVFEHFVISASLRFFKVPVIEDLLHLVIQRLVFGPFHSIRQQLLDHAISWILSAAFLYQFFNFATHFLSSQFLEQFLFSSDSKTLFFPFLHFQFSASFSSGLGHFSLCFDVSCNGLVAFLLPGFKAKVKLGFFFFCCVVEPVVFLVHFFPTTVLENVSFFEPFTLDYVIQKEGIIFS